MVKIAVASTDGEYVNQHFGRASKFYILCADEQTAEYVLAEVREVTPVCFGGGHMRSQMEQAAACLKDCDILLVSKLGMPARDELERVGVDAYEAAGEIDEAVDRVLCYRRTACLRKCSYDADNGYTHRYMDCVQ